MIFYTPIEGDAYTRKVDYRPRTCFVMTQLGEPLPQEVTDIRDVITSLLNQYSIELIDANSVITGRDFLMKIWHLILGVPLGVAIIHHGMKSHTLSNIFYEVGMLQAYGKENLIIKTKNTKIPSDFVRTEYIEFNDGFESKLRKYLANLFNQANYYAWVAEQLEKNPLLAIDYLKRAYLISGDKTLKLRAKEIFDEASIKGRAKNSVEMLLVDF